VYSHDYSFKPQEGLSPGMKSWKERPDACIGDREMFLTKLLVGNEIEMNRDSLLHQIECHALTVPPINPITGLRYDTVTGKTRGSQVWIVYENGRAYPEYLIRYSRRRDCLAPTQTRLLSYKSSQPDESSKKSIQLDLESLHSGSSHSLKSSYSCN
jgi:hypothetical protein